MALLFACGFDGMTTPDLLRFGLPREMGIVSGGMFGGQALGAGQTSDPMRFSVTHPPMFGFFVPTGVGAVCAAPGTFYSFNQQGLFVIGDNVLKVVGVASPIFVGPGPWWVEADLRSGGLVILVNGLPRFSGANPKAGGEISFGAAYGEGAPVGSRRFDDLIMWDDTGDSFNTFPIGPQRIQTLQQTGPGSATEWAADSGANWAAVNKDNWSAGGNGVVSETPDETDSYEVDHLAWDSAQINAVVPRVLALDTGLGGGAVQHRVETPGGVILTPAVQLPQVSPSIESAVVPLAPGGAAWTKALIDDMQVGFVSAEI